MHIPPRILRKHAQDVDHTLHLLDEKETAREELILKTATHLFARFGFTAITFSSLAIAIKLSPTTLRRHFTDTDALVAEIIRRHLKRICWALGDVPRGVPDRPRLLREAYINATRVLGAPIAEQLILLNCRLAIAEDERDTIDATRCQIGRIVCPENPDAALVLLDCPYFDAAQIEAMLAAAEAAAPLPAPEVEAEQPAPEPAPPAGAAPGQKARNGLTMVALPGNHAPQAPGGSGAEGGDAANSRAPPRRLVI